MENIKVEAMIDRFSDQETAVLLAEQIGKEFIVKKDQLPKGAKREDYLVLEVEGDKILSIDLDFKKTKDRKDSVQSKLDRLRQGQTQSRFKRK